MLNRIRGLLAGPEISDEQFVNNSRDNECGMLRALGRVSG